MTKFNYTLENQFVEDYYKEAESKYYSKTKTTIPQEILNLYSEGKYLEYGQAVKKFREGDS